MALHCLQLLLMRRWWHIGLYCKSQSIWYHLSVSRYWHLHGDAFYADRTGDAGLSSRPLPTVWLCSVLYCIPSVIPCLLSGAHCFRHPCLHAVPVASSSNYGEAPVLPVLAQSSNVLFVIFFVCFTFLCSCTWSLSPYAINSSPFSSDI